MRLLREAFSLPRRPRSTTRRPASIVALGASAGGLESLGRVLESLPATFPAPVLVALHLDPHHLSQLVPLLQGRTRLEVRTATSGTRVAAGTVYVAPPDRHLEIRGGQLRLTRTARVSYSRPSVDVLFASVAAAFGPGAIVAVLSGTGRDGAVGVAAVKARGGLAVAEDSSTAGFAGMSTASQETGLLDAVLPVEQIPAFLARAAARRVTVSPPQWRRMLALLHAGTGARFGLYRTTTLHRRLQQRLVARGCRTMDSYLSLLKSDPGELDRLQAAFLIKVSSFTRDPDSWRVLARQVRALANLRTQLRGWSAGCATGEEAYTMAVIFARELGFTGATPWKVFATDLDEGALRIARQGRYTADQVRGLAKADLERYFEREPGTGIWRVGKALRGRVVFGRHDLLHDPPLASIDLLACRNVLIYFKDQEKRRALGRLTTSVNEGGILFLGRSEALRKVPGFDRVGDTTFFRRTRLPLAVAKGTGKSVAPRAKGSKSVKGVRPDGALPGQRLPAQDAPDAGGTPETPLVSVRHRPGAGGAGESRFRAQQDLNEELQSRNEELETVNEELQSLNDELSTMEEQMRGMDEESKRANAFLHLLLDTSSEVLVACDADNCITFWNKAAIKRFRLSPEQAIGGELFDLVPALATPRLRAASRQARKGGRSRRIAIQQKGVEYVFDPLPGSGKRRSYLLRVRPMS
ncbi:MAG TPA: chemotaxis protein CheB [Candidatus Thermoplasmatota archaeon]|nr:chemotaxis protein CheB [Candidatus Thermoplasmatota archaeon]